MQNGKNMLYYKQIGNNISKKEEWLSSFFILDICKFRNKNEKIIGEKVVIHQLFLTHA